jgi:pilus assembly protein CpaB
MVAISVSLSDPARVAGFVNPGSDVAIFVSGTLGGQPYTRLLLPKVGVIGVGPNTSVANSTAGSTDGTGTQNTEQVPTTLLTLAVTQQEAQKVLFAQGNGQLAFALTTDSSKVAPGPATTLAGLFG